MKKGDVIREREEYDRFGLQLLNACAKQCGLDHWMKLPKEIIEKVFDKAAEILHYEWDEERYWAAWR